MELRTLIDNIRAGDETAFAGLVTRYRDMAFGYALTLLHDTHLAEDAAQEAFVAAYIHLDRLQEPNAFAGWLRTIVRHQCRRIQRKQPPKLLSLEQIVDVPATVPGPEQAAQAGELRAQVVAAIAALPPAQREVAVQFYLQERSQSQVAAGLGLPVTTVNSRLHAARTRLKRRMMAMVNEMSEKTIPVVSPAGAKGKVSGLDGPFVDVDFSSEAKPVLYTLLRSDEAELCVVRSLQGGGVRCLPLIGSSPVAVGTTVEDSGAPITQPLDTLLLKQAIRTLTKGNGQAVQILETGIKSIDLFSPLARQGVIGLFAEWGLGVLVLIPELLRHFTELAAKVTLCAFVQPPQDRSVWKENVAEAAVGTSDAPVYYFPTFDPTDPEFVAEFEMLDAQICLARRLAELAIWPCVDPLASHSRLLEPAIVGQEQVEVAQEARRLLRSYFAYQFSLEGAGNRALTQAERMQVNRARKVLRFLSQPFYVAEPYTKTPGQTVRREQAVQGFAALLAGAYDDLSRDAFYMVGTIDQAIEKARTQQH